MGSYVSCDNLVDEGLVLFERPRNNHFSGSPRCASAFCCNRLSADKNGEVPTNQLELDQGEKENYDIENFALFLDLLWQNCYLSLYCITAKLVRVGGAHICVIAPAGNTARFEMLHRWRAVGNTESNLTGPRFESQTSRLSNWPVRFNCGRNFVLDCCKINQDQSYLCNPTRCFSCTKHFSAVLNPNSIVICLRTLIADKNLELKKGGNSPNV